MDTKIDLSGYPNILNKSLIDKVSNKKQPMSDMPYYYKVNDSEKSQDESLFETQYKHLIDSYSRSFNVDRKDIDFFKVLFSLMPNQSSIQKLESDKKPQLINIVENIVRTEFNVDEDEVLFDLEILELGEINLPNEVNIDKKVNNDFKQSDDYDVLKKRTLNCLSQGAALSSHYIFHLYKDEFEKISPTITSFYQKTLVANDLYYFILNDDDLYNNLNDSDTSNNAGYCRINFDGDVPIIEAKAINAPILIHEVTKALITFFTIPGIQNIPKDVIEETDYVMAELWDIRYGVQLWQSLHSLIEENDYDIKKLILIEIFKMDSEFFVKEFMYNVLNKSELAKKEVDYIVRNIRKEIMEYNFLKEDDGFDLSSLGF